MPNNWSEWFFSITEIMYVFVGGGENNQLSWQVGFAFWKQSF